MSAILDIESIHWFAVDVALPDADTTVLVYAPGSDEPVWLGYNDGASWFAVGGEEYSNEEEFAAAVTAWAHIPKGPA